MLLKTMAMMIMTMLITDNDCADHDTCNGNNWEDDDDDDYKTRNFFPSKKSWCLKKFIN